MWCRKCLGLTKRRLKVSKCYNPHCVKSDFFRYWWCILIIFSYGYFHNCFSHQNGGFQSCLLLSIEVKHPWLILFCSEVLKSVPFVDTSLWKQTMMSVSARRGSNSWPWDHVTTGATQPGGRWSERAVASTRLNCLNRFSLARYYSCW